MKTCSECKTNRFIPTSPTHKYCNQCSIERKRKRQRDCSRNYYQKIKSDPEKLEERRRKWKVWRKSYEENNSIKMKARDILRYNVRVGKIIRQPCAVCGLVNAEAHHEDHTRPLDVLWFCKKHHEEYERKAH